MRKNMNAHREKNGKSVDFPTANIDYLCGSFLESNLFWHDQSIFMAI